MDKFAHHNLQHTSQSTLFVWLAALAVVAVIYMIIKETNNEG